MFAETSFTGEDTWFSSMPHGRTAHLVAQPIQQHTDDIGLLGNSQDCAGRNFMPLVQAAAAAAGGRVLGNEYRMAAHGGLPSVIRDDGRGKAFGDKILAWQRMVSQPLSKIY